MRRARLHPVDDDISPIDDARHVGMDTCLSIRNLRRNFSYSQHPSLNNRRDHQSAVGNSLVYEPLTYESPQDMVDSNHVLNILTAENLVVVTIFNENSTELAFTLEGICNNIQKMAIDRGDHVWSSFVVLLIADGRDHLPEKVQQLCLELGLMNPVLMERAGLRSAVKLHLFQSSNRFVQNTNEASKFGTIKFMFAVKEHNAGKIHSHWWALVGFARLLDSKYCYLLDVGTRPAPQTFGVFRKAFDKDEDVAGVCGRMQVRGDLPLSNPFIAAQSFEYLIGGVLVKRTESVCGFLSVLPGACSAYRVSALQGDPLEGYFKYLNASIDTLSPFAANMYLAEDRILCFSLLAKRNQKYTLRFCAEAAAETDVPRTLGLLIKQRRRWLNGAFFALLFAIKGLGGFWSDTRHSFLRRSMVSILFLYYCIGVIVTWFRLAIFYIIFDTIANTVKTEYSEVLFSFLPYLLLGVTALQFIMGLGNRPQEMTQMYNATAIVYGIFLAIISVFGIIYMVRQILDGNTKFFIAGSATFGVPFFAAYVHGALRPALKTFLQAYFLIPTFHLMFVIYSFCNTHDISWGTKRMEISIYAIADETPLDPKLTSGDTRNARQLRRRIRAAQQKIKASKEAASVRFKHFRTTLVLWWLFSNAVLAISVTKFGVTKEFFLGSFFTGLGVTAIRFCGSMLYLVVGN